MRLGRGIMNCVNRISGVLMILLASGKIACGVDRQSKL
jgi:hypothetical protein